MNDPCEVHLYVASLRDAPSVQDQPSVDLRQWHVSALCSGALILNGFLADRPTIRTTTAIVAVENGCVRTSSGRQYQLLGEPASDPEILALIAQKMALAGHHCFQDATPHFVRRLRDVTRKNGDEENDCRRACRTIGGSALLTLMCPATARETHLASHRVSVNTGSQ